jgi:general L-amino acid transport system permease protein
MSDVAAQTAQSAFVRASLSPSLPPPRQSDVIWRRWNLFGSPLNTALTLLCLLLIWLLLWPALKFLFIDAVWTGTSRDACLAAAGRPTGACWPFIAAKFSQFIYGFYPQAQRWRVDLTFVLGAALLLPLLIPRLPYKILNAFAFFGLFPVAGYFLLVGGAFGLAPVATSAWGGLLITLVVAFSGIMVSLPLGVVLALARRSRMPVVRAAAVVFIEFWRGVPLVAVLFFATYMLPLFLPPGWHFDALLRVLVGVALFASAYMAEVVRGGLQAIPRGQYEAASALGLGYATRMGLVILPQALRIVIPGIVNVFIGLFKDTTLVLTVAIFDLLGQLRAAFADPNWASPATLFTGFAFAGAIYFLFCFGMSRYSQFVERRLRAQHPRGAP